MKCFFVLFLMSLVVLSTSETTTEHSRGCRYILGKCVEECPVGTHAYAIGCDRKLPEATCEQPKPVLEEGILCDFSDCYCDPPTVRDTKTKKCVHLEECPKAEN